MIETSLEVAFAELDLVESGPAGLRARVVEGMFVDGRPAFVAKDWEGLRHLLLPTDLETNVLADARSGGIRITERDLVDAGRTERYVDVACLKPHLDPLFSIVAGEMLKATAATTLGAVPGACRAVLKRWRELIEQASGDAVGIETIVGAWGELWFVREALRHGATSEGLWTGPLGGIHDLEGRNGTAIEVKTTLSRGPLLVEIHGLDQLEVPPKGNLYLGVLRLRRTGQGESLADLVRTCAESGGDAATIARLLAAIGLIPSHAELADQRFSLAERRFYRVNPRFPRIVRSSFVDARLPPGTASLVYRLDLTGEPPIPLDMDTFDEVMSALGERPA
jgi:hypothetical protein